jgi:hypothetical protein
LYKDKERKGMDQVTLWTKEHKMWTITNGTFSIKDSTRTVEFYASGSREKIIIPLENITTINTIKQSND